MGKTAGQGKGTRSVFELTTRELRKEIRRLTIEVNERIRDYRAEGGNAEYFNRMVNRLKYVSSHNKKITIDGEEHVIKTVPKGYKGGEIGLGTSYKLKIELQEQLSSLHKFLEKDEYSPQGIEEFNEKVQRQYETFTENYGYITKEEYLEMIDTMNLVKESLKGYGYEDLMATGSMQGFSLGASLANKYVEANERGRGTFLQYVEQAKKMSKGGTTEDLFDNLTEIMKTAGVL